MFFTNTRRIHGIISIIRGVDNAPGWYNALPTRHIHAIPVSKIIESTRRNYTKKIDGILTLSKRSDLIQQAVRLWVDPKIIAAIRKYPYLLSDIIVVFHRYQHLFSKNGMLKNKDPQNDWSFIDDIVSLFLRYNSEKWENPIIIQDIETLIQNQEFVKLTQQNSKKQRSLIWFPNSKFRYLRDDEVARLIQDILRHNTATHSNDTIDREFSTIVENIDRWMNEIFSVSILQHIPEYSDVTNFSIKLARLMKTGWLWSEIASEFIRCLYAWSDYENIERIRDKAIGFEKDFISILSASGIYLEWDVSHVTIKRETISSGKFNVPIWNDNKKIRIQWRVKSLRSILLKLRCDKRYSNAEYLRDLFWGFVFPDSDLTPHERREVLKKLISMLEPYAYVLKNRWVLDEVEERGLLTEIHPPFNQKTALKERSAKDYSSLQLWWYTRGTPTRGTPNWKIWKAMGIEFQYFHTEGDSNPQGFWNHLILDVAKIVEGWSEWAKMITREQLLKIIGENIPASLRSQNWIPEDNTDILEYFIWKDGKLDAYTLISMDWSTTVHVWKGKERAFLKEFPGAERKELIHL